MNSLQLTTLHRILRASKTECFALLVKHLFHQEAAVALSALNSLFEQKATNLFLHYRNLYKTDHQAIKNRILENLTALPELEAQEFLLDLCQQEKNEDLKCKALIALGSLAIKNDQMLNFLREKMVRGGSGQTQRMAAAKALFLAGDYNFISSKIMKIYHQKEESAMTLFLLKEIAQYRHAELFISLYKFYRNLKEYSSEQDILLCQAVFATHKSDRDTDLLLSQFREKFLQICRSASGKELDFHLQVLTLVPFDSSWAVKILNSLVVRNDLNKQQEQKRVEIFNRMLPIIITDFSLRKSLTSLVKRIVEACNKLLSERLKRDLESAAEQQKYEFCDFLEQLGNQSVFHAVVKFLKGPVSAERRQVLVELLKKIFPALSDIQKKRMPTVLQLINTDDGRIRATLVVECGRMNFEDTPQKIFLRLQFLLSLAHLLLDEQLFKTIQDSYQILGDLERHHYLRPICLSTFLASNNSLAIEFAWQELADNFKGDMHSIIDQALQKRTTPLSEAQLNFLAKIFMVDKPDFWQINGACSLLLFCQELLDGSWSENFVFLLKNMNYQEQNESLVEDIWLLLSRNGTPLALDFITDYLSQQQYVLNPMRVNLLLSFSRTHKNTEISPVLLELLYACLIEQNSAFFPDLGFLLFLAQEDYGQVLLAQGLESTDKALVRKTLNYCIELAWLDIWPQVFSLLNKSDIMLTNLIVKYFSVVANHINQVEMQAFYEDWLSGNVAEKLVPTVLEPDKINLILGDMEKSNISSKSRIGFNRNQQELTIFFIDIAGYTKFCNNCSQEQIIAMLKEFTGIIEPIGEKFFGRLIKKIGDCLMYTFVDSVSALLMALEVQAKLIYRNDFCVNEEKIHARIGLNTGPVYLMDNDVFGDAVNLASRIEAQAPIDGILAHESTLQHCGELFLSEKQPLVQVKGIVHPIQTYVVLAARNGVLDAYLQKANER